MRVLIVDDEPDARENLRMMLEEHCPDLIVVGSAGSAQEARELIAMEHPQALFLDIKMPGEDGFALLRSLQGQELPVVFTTAYDEYALQAFRENALDYLEKPIDVEELKRASSKLRRMTLGSHGRTATDRGHRGVAARPRITLEQAHGRARTRWAHPAETRGYPLPGSQRQLHHHPYPRRQAADQQQAHPGVREQPRPEALLPRPQIVHHQPGAPARLQPR
ncbi:MAG: response regulator [Flavobacteriales bacterium]|nr:response regulator [Flavobacteriales bacterium]